MWGRASADHRKWMKVQCSPIFFFIVIYFMLYDLDFKSKNGYIWRSVSTFDLKGFENENCFATGIDFEKRMRMMQKDLNMKQKSMKKRRPIHSNQNGYFIFGREKSISEIISFISMYDKFGLFTELEKNPTTSALKQHWHWF